MSPDLPPRLARGMWKRFGLAALVVVTLTAAATATAALLDVSSFVSDFTPNGGSKLNAQVDPVKPGAPQTLLLIGSDRRFKDRRDVRNARSDTIILVRLNADASATSIMSIPRDLKVRLRRRGGRVQTDKINAAYSIGGPDFTARTVRALLSRPGRPFKINHIVNVNFGGFRAAVDFLGCVYTDVDRRYFNDNSQAGYGQDYATINLKPGYQRLCGSDALDYVRFRHADTDIVRSARQQDFLRQAKDQYGVGKLIANRHRLARIFGRFTQSDARLHSVNALLQLMTLVASTASNPLLEVRFPARLPNNPLDPYVTASPSAVERAVSVFLNGPKPRAAGSDRAQAPRRRVRRQRLGGVTGVTDGTAAGRQQAAALGRIGMPVYFPKLITSSGTYETMPGVYPRNYRIRDRSGRSYPAYRMTVRERELGNYYGIQGTRWTSPPLLARPSEIRVVSGRRLELFFDGSRLRTVAWRRPGAVYWVSNTLQQLVGNRQILAIAASLSRR